MNLRRELIKLATQDPTVLPYLSPLLRTLYTTKSATADSTSKFIDWVLLTRNDDKMSPAAVEHFFKQHLGIEPSPFVPPPAKRGPDLELGDYVRVDAEKAPPVNDENAERWANQIGRIAQINKNAEFVVVRFEDGREATFFGTKTGATTGLYRHTPIDNMSDRVLSPKMIEVVYFSKPGEVGAYRKSVVDSYLHKGLSKGEDRSENYYTGQVKKFAYGKDGDIYFTLMTAQRSYPVSISPGKGSLLYIGILNKRPNWEGDIERIEDRL